MKGKGLITFFQKYLFYFIILIVGIAYILTGVSNIIKTSDDLQTIISSIALSTILGWLISALFGQQAIIDGYNDNDVVSATNSLGNQVEKIEKDIDKLDTYCDIENEETMIRKRTRILKKVGIEYQEFLAMNKTAYKQLHKRAKKAVNKAYKIGFGFLTTDWLLTDIEQQDEKNYKPVSIQKYSQKKNATNFVGKMLTGIISGLYILEPFVGWQWNIIIWRLFFFALWLIFGYVRYITDFNFVTKEHRKNIIFKTNELVKFEISLRENPNLYKKEVIDQVETIETITAEPEVLKPFENEELETSNFNIKTRAVEI